MAWSTIRKATDEDAARLAAAAERFCRRHKIKVYENETPEDAIAQAILYGPSDGFRSESLPARIAPLWKKCVQRALDSKNAEGIAYGYVGFNVQG